MATATVPGSGLFDLFDRVGGEGTRAYKGPFLPPDGSFGPHGKPVRVLLTQPAHYRGTTDFVVGYGASVWVPPRAV